MFTMKNIKKFSENCRASAPPKKAVKRLKPNNSAGNLLSKKLEPQFIVKKATKFKSPYRGPQLLKIATETKVPTKEKFQQNPTTNPQQIPSQNLNKFGQNKLSNNSKVQAPKSTSLNATILPKNAPKMSPAKIQPIDPYKFCEPIVKDCGKMSMVQNCQKDSVFNRPWHEQSKINQEVLALIKRTAEAIKTIRSQHDEWLKSYQKQINN